MKFFAKQKQDAVGVTAVTLQKILLFLMILSLFTVFNGGFFSFFLCLIGFLGAYRRHTGMLTAYVTISVVLIVLCFFIAFTGMVMVTSDDYVYDYSSSSSEGLTATDSNQGSMYKLQRAIGRKLSALGGAGSQSASSSESHSSDSYNGASMEYDSYEEDDVTGIIFLSIVVLVIGFFLAYLKVYSMVLAWRLRKMIFAAATALPTTEEKQQVHEFAPANTSCAVENTVPPAPMAPFQPAPYFAPGFAPYPYPMPMMMPPHMQGQPGQIPHHVMFGQQPVFYTYAPTPQSEEKL